MWFAWSAAAAGVYVQGDPADHPTIQAALDAAPAGATILVGPGVYPEHLRIDRSVTLRGAGPRRTVIRGAAGSDFIVAATLSLAGAQRVELRGLTFAPSLPDQGALLVYNVAGTLAVVLDDLELTGHDIPAPSGSVQALVLTGSGVDHIELRRTWVHDNLVGGGYAALHLTCPAGDVLVDRLVFVDNDASGVILDGSSQDNASFAEIRDSRFEDNSGIAVNVAADGLVLAHNEVLRNHTGFDLYPTAGDPTVVRGNRVEGNDIAMSLLAAYGGAWDSRGNLFVDNVSNGVTGLAADYTSRGDRFCGNGGSQVHVFTGGYDIANLLVWEPAGTDRMVDVDASGPGVFAFATVLGGSGRSALALATPFPETVSDVIVAHHAGLAFTGSPGTAVDRALLWDLGGPGPNVTVNAPIVARPRFLGAVLDGDCDTDDLRLHPASPAVNAGDPLLHDPDGTPADLGAYGGPDAAGWNDDDGDGSLAWVDCDDADPAVRPSGAEICDGVDNDCDSEIDDADVAMERRFQTTWWPDLDGDGAGDAHHPGDGFCAAPGAGWASTADDCDDTDLATGPGVADPVGDGVDRDCDGVD